MDSLNCTLPHFVWGIEHSSGETVIIRYNYHEPFAVFIKSIPYLKWDSFLRGWIAHIDYTNDLYNMIVYNFPEWKCIDLRNV
jgi:hypothetical protein